MAVYWWDTSEWKAATEDAESGWAWPWTVFKGSVSAWKGWSLYSCYPLSDCTSLWPSLPSPWASFIYPAASLQNVQLNHLVSGVGPESFNPLAGWSSASVAGRFLIYISRVKVKKSLYRPGLALRISGGWGSQILTQSEHEGGKVVSPTHRPPLPLGNITATNFC